MCPFFNSVLLGTGLILEVLWSSAPVHPLPVKEQS